MYRPPLPGAAISVWLTRLYAVRGTSVDVRQRTARCGKLRFADHIRSAQIARDVFAKEGTHTQISDPNSRISIIRYDITEKQKRDRTGEDKYAVAPASGDRVSL
jgi:hypothetical protein